METKIYFTQWLIIIAVAFSAIDAQTTTTMVPLQLKRPQDAVRGLVLPRYLEAVMGNEAFLTLSRTLVNQQNCSITTPSGDSFTLQNLDTEKYEAWGVECGVRVKNLQPIDTGRWRIASVRGETRIQGFVNIHVLHEPEIDQNSTTNIHYDDTNTKIELDERDQNQYCLVNRPLTESGSPEVHPNCIVPLEKVTRNEQGSWDIISGVRGAVDEVVRPKNVVVEVETLDAGHVHDTSTNKLHLYCNVLHSKKHLDFCRFHRSGEQVGYRVVAGLGNGNYSYYGRGFLYNDCGMTVEDPSAHDLQVSWRCMLGLTEGEGSDVKNSTMRGLIIVKVPENSDDQLLRSNSETSNQSIVPETTLSVKGEPLTLQCTSEVQLTYCWFQHPNGSQFTANDLSTDQQLYWYSGEGLEVGDCSITFATADESETGSWTCHMGQFTTLGVEQTKTIQVRISGPLVAASSEIEAHPGEETVLSCGTSGSRRPLRYCRFTTPDGVGINLDETITRQNPILSRYFFPKGSSLPRGDCALAIVAIQEEDQGVWTCAAFIYQDDGESRDQILLTRHVTYYTSSGLSVASVTGMAIGAVFMLAVACGLVAWRKIRTRRQSEMTEMMDFNSVAMDSPRTSAGSGSQSSQTSHVSNIKPIELRSNPFAST